jgi:hypothetical protein
MNTGGEETINQDFYNVANIATATKLFEFMANNTNVEWSKTQYDKIGGVETTNILLTTHQESSVSTGTIADWKMEQGWTLTGADHNHPSGDATPSGQYGDLGNAARLHRVAPNATFRIYTARDKKYTIYSSPIKK